MATDFIMPRLPDQQQHPFYPPPLHAYAPPALQQQHVPLPAFPPQPYSGQASPLSTPNNASPTSPRSYHGRQNRPLFMPAVLRPTEFPSKTPLQKAKIKADAEDATEDDKPLRSSGSFISLSGLSALGRLSRRSTGDSGNGIHGKWNLDLFPPPKGAPNTDHWKPDSESLICDETTCKRRFGTWTRRHHCRKCGNIFCDFHSAYQIPLDQDISFNPRASPVRACAHCYGEFKLWRSRTNSQASSPASSPQNAASMPTSPITATPVPTTPVAAATPAVATPAAAITPPTRTPDAAMSVPRDWNWSTF